MLVLDPRNSRSRPVEARRPCRSSSSLPHAGLSEGHREPERLPLQQHSKIHYHRAQTDDHVADNNINAMLTHDGMGAMSMEYDRIHKHGRVNMTVASWNRAVAAASRPSDGFDRQSTACCKSLDSRYDCVRPEPWHRGHRLQRHH